ncbi:hypothetical protein B0A48_13418 [Cryoendolithus antarcticus]|uniref:CBM1 domain-containing protein n=1 Tax=Cryoendolithus antarcticus TaxID=1507870 RepID=A0A1V8SPT3_9PEZI|nr:hypothetical protein B0A48_13418 [Cryoendolithus antarcticus]
MVSTTLRAALAAGLIVVPAAVAQQAIYAQCGGSGYSGGTTCRQLFVDIVCMHHDDNDQLSRFHDDGNDATSIIDNDDASSCIDNANEDDDFRDDDHEQSIKRAVEDPNFHKYLQTSPQYTTGLATLNSYTTAGQFNVVNGQLVELISATATSPTLLYANVGQPATPSSSLLPVSFSTTQNGWGSFAFSGDALTWSAANVTRGNLAAWYVCTGQQLFINTGAYLYGTPSGCYDETIHFYNGATAVA